MDERLIALAKSNNISPNGYAEGCMDWTGSFPENYNWSWATAPRVKLACELLPILFEETRNRKASRSSYGLKHDVEHLFQQYAPELSSVHSNYLSNGELILAMAYCGFHSHGRERPCRNDCLNALYLLKDKRKGANNKKGKAKALADETEAKIKEFLRQKVAEHSRPKE